MMRLKTRRALLRDDELYVHRRLIGKMSAYCNDTICD